MTLDCERRGGVLLVTINRPERRNALDPETFSAFGDTFTEAEADSDVKAIVLTGAGDKAFCSGMDLKAFAAGQGIDASAGPGTGVFLDRLYRKPIIAAVNGDAVGGGFGIVLGCDLVVAAEHAHFGLPEVKRGLVGTGATTRAVVRLPPAIALEMALTGDPMTAHDALGYGLVNRVVPAADVVPTALALAGRIAQNGPLAVAMTKEIMYEVRGLVGAVDMGALRARTASVFQSNDAREGALAFAEKRSPTFTGT